MKNKNDLINGNILSSLILFSLPILGSSLIQQLYNTADMIFVGNFLNKNATAAVGASSQLIVFFIGLFTGFSVGVGIVVSQKTGIKDTKEVKKTVNTAISFSFICGLFLSLLGLIFTKELLIFLNTPKEIMSASILYLKIYFLSVLPMVIFNLGSGIIRATGDSKTPFYILIIGGLLNILGNFIFIVFLNMGVVGVAVSTFVSQLVTAILVLFILNKKNKLLSLNLKKLGLNFSILKRIITLGLPMGLQATMLTFSNITVQYFINSFGENCVASYAVYFKLENFLWLPIVAVGQSITTFVAQNTGAKNFLRVKKGTIIATFLSMFIVIIITGTILVFPKIFFKIFIKDNEIINLGISIISVTFPFYWLYSVLETMGGSIRGMGHTFTSMLIVVSVLCVLRIVLLFNLNMDFKSIAYIYPITWFIAAILFFTMFLKYVNMKIKIQ